MGGLIGSLRYLTPHVYAIFYSAGVLASRLLLGVDLTVLQLCSAGGSSVCRLVLLG